jgi:hypothetical protein
MQRIWFIDQYLERSLDDEFMTIVVDEAGFGTSPLRKYGYSLKGEPLTHEYPKLSHNVSMIAAIS